MSTFDPDNSLSTHIGNVIRQRRREMNMTQKELAEFMGTSQIVISNYEIGETAVKAADLPRIAEALRVPIQQFFHPEAWLSRMDEKGVYGNGVKFADMEAMRNFTISRFLSLNDKAQFTVCTLVTNLAETEQRQGPLPEKTNSGMVFEKG